MRIFDTEADMITISGDIINYSGIADLDDIQLQKKRFKYPKRQADWGKIVMQLIKEGMDYQKMSELTGFKVNMLKAIAAGNYQNEVGDRTIALLGLYTMNIGCDVPLIGVNAE